MTVGELKCILAKLDDETVVLCEQHRKGHLVLYFSEAAVIHAKYNGDLNEWEEGGDRIALLFGVNVA